MKKFLLTILIWLSAGIALTQAQTINALDGGKYALQLGDVTMTVDGQHGGKITSFRYGDIETISQSRFPNSFGSTFWTSPQKEWNWPPVPEYDSKPFTVENSAGSLILVSDKSEKFGYRLKKKFEMDPKDNAFVITYTIINESDRTRQVSPWEITRTPNGGMIFFESSEVTPGYGKANIDFVFTLDAAWFTLDVKKEQRKINSEGTGWLGFLDNGLLFVKSFPDLDQSDPAPGEAEIQFYIHGDNTYLEIEEQGAYTTLEPGEEVNWTTRWYLVPCDMEEVPSKALLKKAKKIAKKK